MRAVHTKIERIAKAADDAGDARVRDAAALWSRLSEPVQRRLSIEAIETRVEELKAAYGDLVSAGSGYRRVGERRSKRGTLQAHGELTDEVCVVLTVARKKKPRGGGQLPRYLLAYTDVAPRSGRKAAGGKKARKPVADRRLVAIPTDVRSMDEFRARPRTSEPAQVTSRVPSTGTAETGMFACTVRLPGQGGLYGLSCHHFLARSEDTTPPGTPGVACVAAIRGAGATIGPLETGVIGTLTIAPGKSSLDAALCSPDGASGLAALRRATAWMDATVAVRESAEIPRDCVVLRQDGKEIPLHFVADHLGFSGIEYFKGSAKQPVQPVVLEFEAVGGETTGAGDSGSAVMSANGIRFVGVHIAGTEGSNLTFVLPAYEALNLDRWQGGLSGMMKLA